MQQRTENNVKKSILTWLHLNGYYAIRINQIPAPGRRAITPPGVPDIYFMGNGRWGWVEAKKPGAKTNPERLHAQEEFLERVRQAGGIGIMAASLDEFMEKIP